MTSTRLKAAIEYQQMGFSVIPVRRNKRPYFEWREYQIEKASESQLRKWWEQFPDANVAIITGEVSGIDVIDVDSPQGHEALCEHLHDRLFTPIARTPKGGWHLYHEHMSGLGNATRFIKDCDFRGEGGYIIAPPSMGMNGNPYKWLPQLSITDLAPTALPVAIVNILKNSIPLIEHGIHNSKTPALQTVTDVTKGYISFEKGNRDNALFHIANALVKGGMAVKEINKLLQLIATRICIPPFPTREIPAKIRSALLRAEGRERILSQEVFEWVSVTQGYFSVTDCDRALQIVTKDDMANRRVILHRLVKSGVLERHPDREGLFRRIQNECEIIDWVNADDQPFDVKWPFEIEKLALLYPKTLAVIAGSQNTGKTALALNLARMNRGPFDVRYFSSEMGKHELKGRLRKFDMPLEHWKDVDFRERSTNFADVLLPEGLNIIDYYEISDKFWLIADDLMKIYAKLKGGIAVICLQKSEGKSAGRGGDFGLEKPKLYLNLDQASPDGAVLSIRKAKEWAVEGKNPNQYKTRFKIVNGAKLIQQGGWYLE